MPKLRKLIPILFLVCAQVWAQSGPPSTQGSDSKPQITQPSQTAQDSDTKTPPSAPLPDSTKLEPIKTQKPPYPDEAREQKLQGQVVVRAFVSETGDVENVEEVSGDSILAKAATDAVKEWKFKPFIKDGKPVKASTKLAFNFAFSENINKEKVPTDLPASVKRVRISAGVSGGLLIRRVTPAYPPEARRAHIQGTVILHAVIDKEGKIADLQVVSGPKELTQAAIGAVQQWRYKPYLLMGAPVEVDTEVQVNFQLRW
jgi:TonB family protein